MALIHRFLTLILMANGACGVANSQGTCSGNLVPNAGFEAYSTCPSSTGQVSRAVGWGQPTGGTSDYFNSCASAPVGVPSNVFGNEWGVGLSNGYVGFVTFKDDRNYREYVQVQLASPLLPGRMYEVSFYVSLADTSEYAVRDIGAVFTTGAIGNTNSLALNIPMDVANRVDIISKRSGPAPLYGWTRICGSFHSGAGGQRFLTIGNMSSDTNTLVSPPPVTPFGGIAYYFLDDVCVRMCDAAPVVTQHPMDQTVSFCDPVEFRVDAGCGVSYQWFRAYDGSTGTPILNVPGYISGATDSVLRLSPAAAADYRGWEVFAVATNDCGSAPSDRATVTISPAPQVFPTTLSVCPPEPASLSVSFAGSGYTYQWYKRPKGSGRNGTQVPRATGPVLDGNAPAFWWPTPSDCGMEYYCVIRKPGCGEIWSPQVPVECCDCVMPPPQMGLWLPFDAIDPIYPTTANVVVAGYRGELRPSKAAGPWLWQGSYAGNALFFDGVDDHVRVLNHHLVDITDGDLTVDAWIFIEGANPDVAVITDKRMESGGTRGYHMFLQASGSSHRLGFQLADGTHTNWLSSPSAILGPGWNHVAVTVDRDDPSGGRFYINGLPAGTFDPTSRQGSLSNTGPFTVGARSTTPSGFFAGAIDEVEVFRRSLSATEVAAIADARGIGKCKQFCQVPHTSVFCGTSGSTTVTAHVFNFASTPAAFTGGFYPSPCPTFAPSNFPVSAPITLPNGFWGLRTTTASRPTGMLLLDEACFKAEYVVSGSGQTISDTGVIVNRPDLSCFGPLTTAVNLALHETATIALGFGNDGMSHNPSDPIDIRVFAIGPDGTPSRTVAINGGEPGDPFERTVTVPIGSVHVEDVETTFVEVDALGVTTLVLATDADRDGVFEPAAVTVLTCTVTDAPPPCVADYNAWPEAGDILDLLDFFEDFGTCLSEPAPCGTFGNPDVNGDTVVDILDLLDFLDLFTVGC